MREKITPYLNKKMFFLLIMGFSSGLPLALTGSTLQAWMKDLGYEIKTIGLFSLVGLPYTIKFIWAPFLDRFKISRFGKRKSWILLFQILIIFSLQLLSSIDNNSSPNTIAILALLISFFSASQDIVVDAYRTEILVDKERGFGSSVSNLGYRLAMLTSGALALMLSDHYPWPTVINQMSMVMLFTLFICIFSEEPIINDAGPKTLKQAVVLPFINFFKLKGSLEILLFIILYKIDIVLAVSLTTPFMKELGFSNTDIGAVTKGVGMIASIVGSLYGGILYARLGLKRCLLYFGIIQGLSTLSFSVLALVGNNYIVMATTVALENFCAGLATAPFIAFIMSFCSAGYAATSFALLSSFASISRVVAGAPAGYIVSITGWTLFFAICALTSVPGILLLVFRFEHWNNKDH